MKITKITALAKAENTVPFKDSDLDCLPEVRIEAELEPDDNPEACAEELQERAHIMLTRHCKRMAAAVAAAERMRNKKTGMYSAGNGMAHMSNIHLTMEDANASMLRQIVEAQGSQIQKAFDNLSKEERTTEFRRAMGVVEDITS